MSPDVQRPHTELPEFETLDHVVAFWAKNANVQDRGAKAVDALKHLKALEANRQHTHANLDACIEQRQRLEEQLETLRVVLETAYNYYPKDTPMSESMRDALNPAKRPT